MLTRGQQIFQEGYDKYPTGLFKVPSVSQWEFVAGGGELVEDLRRAGSKELSFHQKVIDVSFTFVLRLCSNPIESFDVVVGVEPEA